MYELQVSPNTRSTGCTLLMKALVESDETTILHCITSDPSTIHVQSDRGWTALHIACRNSTALNLFPYISILLSHGANLDLQTDEGWTALMHAARYANTDSSYET
jgi:ankyrin repeat protein